MSRDSRVIDTIAEALLPIFVRPEEIDAELAATPRLINRSKKVVLPHRTHPGDGPGVAATATRLVPENGYNVI
jgi:hypothetical protein